MVLATNLIDRHNFKKNQNSIETIYDDRLVAQDVIYDLTNIIHQKIMANTIADSVFYETTNYTLNKEVESLLVKYESTKLTSKEENLFLEFKTKVNNLLKSEKTTPNGVSFDRNENKVNLDLIIQDLQSLAEIQLIEGDQEKKISKESLKNIELLTQMEVYGLIALAIIILLVVIVDPKKIK